MLTKRVQRNLIDRRSFIKGAVALGLTASAAMLIYQAYDHGQVGTALAQENLVRRLWPLEDMTLDTYDMWERTEGKTFVNVSRLAAHPYHQIQDITWTAECNEAGMGYTLLDTAFDPAKEIENLDLVISRGFDVVMGGPVDPSSASPDIKRMREAGQIVINYDSDSLLVRPTLKHGRVIHDCGFHAGTWLGENLPPGSKVVGGTGELISSGGIDRKAGFLDGIAPFDVELLGFEDGHGWTSEGGYDAGRAMLTRFPEIQGVYFGNDDASVGFSRAATDLGRRDEMLIVGVDGLRAGQEAVADGRLDMSVMMIYGFGPEAVLAADYAFSLVRANQHGDAMEGAHITEVLDVTKENLADQWVSPV